MTTVHLAARDVPVFGSYDVCVAGGGMTGIGAALAAARSRASVLLVERLEILGGLGSSGGVGNFSYGESWEGVGQGKIFDDVLDGLKALRAIGPENGWRAHENEFFHNRTFDHTALPWVLQQLFDEAGVDVLFATDVVGAVVEDGRCTSALIHNRSMLQAVCAAVFIDATGEGLLARHAGAATMPVRDPNLPELIKPSNMVFLHHASRPTALPEFPGETLDPARPPSYSVWPEPNRVGLKTRLFDRDYDTGAGRGYSDAVIAFRKHAPTAVRHYLACVDSRDRDLSFEYIAPLLGIREGRRVVGDYVLTMDDVLNGRRFADAVAFGTSCLDAPKFPKRKTSPYQVPLRSLLVKGLSNVLVGGRCFSGDRAALASTRVMCTGCLMGQAAGYAAAFAVRDQHALRKSDPAAIRRAIMAGARCQDYLETRLASA